MSEKQEPSKEIATDILQVMLDRDTAQRTLELTGLDRYGQNVTSEADRRWIKRSEAYGKAENALKLYEINNRSLDNIQSIIDTATSTGFWSVWIKVFENEQNVIIALVNAFLNTYPNYETNDINRL